MAKMNRYDYIKMMREKQHAEQKEERLERKNEFDLKDLTPYNAVRTMQGKDIVYK